MRDDAILDLSLLSEVFEDDRTQITEFLEFALKRGAVECGELDTIVNSENGVRAREVAHRIKGALSNIGAFKAARVCAEIERAVKSGAWPEAKASVRGLEGELDEITGVLKRYKEESADVVRS
jgi:HPt (histidine-containing phosphotransfer) domain-containing protein